MAIVSLSSFSHKVISNVTLMTYRKNNRRTQYPFGKNNVEAISFQQTWQISILDKQVSSSRSLISLSTIPPYMYCSSCKMFMINISPVHSPLPWCTVVIFWLPSFTSSGQIFVNERVTTLPPTRTFTARTNPSSSSTTSIACQKDHYTCGTSARITKTTSPTFTFRLTDCHFFLWFNVGTNSNIQRSQKCCIKSWTCFHLLLKP